MEAFFLLITYYVNECSSAKAGQGAFAIHPDLKSLFCEMLPENLPFNTCPPPADIVNFLKLSQEHEKSYLGSREDKDMFSPPYNNYRSSNTEDTMPLSYPSASVMTNSKFSFNTSLEEFGLSTSLPPNWLSNGDILALADDDRQEIQGVPKMLQNVLKLFMNCKHL